ncbi:hypothetical protein PTKIN_Ptkin16aG0104200 [Pterospermum kingtungense]
MVLHNRMPPLDRLISWGLSVDDICRLCGRDKETRNHLFFGCCSEAELELCVHTRCTNVCVFVAGSLLNFSCFNHLSPSANTRTHVTSCCAAPSKLGKEIDGFIWSVAAFVLLVITMLKISCPQLVRILNG